MVPSVPPASAPLAGLSRDQLVAASSGWLAVSLNLGCQGWGYVYQRRWGAFWIGGLAASGAALLLGTGSAILVNTLSLPGSPETSEGRAEWTTGAALLGAYTGVFAVGMGSAVEAGLAVNRARKRLH